jgi:hypothetical protein
MTKNELFIKNNMLSTEFDLYLLDHPEVAEEIPENAIVVLMPDDDPELAETNLKMAEDMQEPGQPMVLVRIKKMKPIASRIAKLEMEIAEDY